MSISFTLSLPAIRETAGERCQSPDDVIAQVADLRNAAQEALICITLDTKNRVIDKHLVTLGTLNASLAHPREVFRHAVMDAAASIILAHNHPSGDPTPSPEDIRITRQLVEVGKVIEIQILDHIIIGRPDHVSLRETGMVQFS